MADEPTVCVDLMQKRLTGIPDSSIFTDGVGLPIGSIWNRLKSPVEGEAHIMLSFDPTTGAWVQTYLYNSLTGKGEAQRTVTKLIPSGLISNIGTTVLWTPAAGKKFRLLGFSVIIRVDTTTAAGSLITLLDGATPIDNVCWIAATVTTQPNRWSAPLPGNGYLSTAAGNVLYVNCSAALTAGGIYINVWGCEE